MVTSPASAVRVLVVVFVVDEGLEQPQEVEAPFEGGIDGWGRFGMEHSGPLPGARELDHHAHQVNVRTASDQGVGETPELRP